LKWRRPCCPRRFSFGVLGVIGIYLRRVSPVCFMSVVYQVWGGGRGVCCVVVGVASSWLLAGGLVVRPAAWGGFRVCLCGG